MLLCHCVSPSSLRSHESEANIRSQCRTISDPHELSELAELGVLFLLFEMGLELSSSRLSNLSKYAFGLGTAQVVATTIVFVLFTVPFGSGVGTLLLEQLAGAEDAMARIDTWDEAIVVAVALSLSSSAFVLQILAEKGQLSTRAGSATLGILLLQDLTTIPFLVLLPLLGGPDSEITELVRSQPISLLGEWWPTILKTLGYLGALVLFGRFGLRRVFEVVAGTNSKDAFVALCILTVCGTAMATENLGFGQTLGAFLAGVLLAETSYRSQVEADLKPFKGLLLGLFFLCTGASVDVDLLIQRFPVVALLTLGLISVKFAITATSARFFGLSKTEAIKVGLTLSQGGEFAFVLLELARQIQVLPAELNSLLIIVVVMSMALTPFLAEWGDYIEQSEQQREKLSAGESLTYEIQNEEAAKPQKDMVVLCGFNKASQMVTNMISSPLVGKPVPWIAFEFDPKRVRSARESKLPVMFGDGSRKEVLQPAGVEAPLAFVLTQKSHLQMMESLQRIKKDFPSVPIYALCRDMRCASELQRGGAMVKISSAQGGIALGDLVLRGIGTPDIDLLFLEQEMLLAVQERVREAAKHPESENLDLEVFVFDRAQARSVVNSNKVRIRGAAALPRQLDIEQPFLSMRSSPLSSTDANLDYYSDDSDDSDVEWASIPPDTITADEEARLTSTQTVDLQEASAEGTVDLERPESRRNGKSILQDAKESIDELRRSASRSGSQDESDTEWDKEDIKEFRDERDSRKCWEQLQLTKPVAHAQHENDQNGNGGKS